MGLAAALLAFFLSDFVAHGYRFPVGPDAPVYLWWMRLAGHDGLSAVGHRPGVPALSLVAAGTLHVGPAAGLAALECVLGVAVGLAAAALVGSRGGAGRGAWILAGALAGTFAVHLATGYLANLAFAALFLAAAAALASATRRGAVAAALLLAASGLAHPLFFLLGVVILGLGAGLALLAGERDEAARVAGAVVGGGALLGLGLLALLAGPGPLSVDTSKDGFLRRAGLTGELRSVYVDRFLHHWTRYVQWASLPLAITGLGGATGFVGRFLRAWGVVVIGGVAVALITGFAPADRFEAFGYVVPILAALGLVRLWAWLRHRRRAVAVLATGALVAAMLAGAGITWRRQAPFITTLEVERITVAGRFASAVPPGRALVFPVETGNDTITFFATQAANAIRASLPPDRIRDASIVVAASVAGRTAPAGSQRAALATLYARDLAGTLTASEGRYLLIQLAPLDRPDFGGSAPEPLDGGAAPVRVSPGVAIRGYPSIPTPVRAPVEPLEPASPGGIVGASVALFALVVLAGFGWARAALDRGLAAWALAPALGAAALILGGILLERLGLPLTGSVGPTVASVLAGGSGYAVWFVLERRAGGETSTQI